MKVKNKKTGYRKGYKREFCEKNELPEKTCIQMKLIPSGRIESAVERKPQQGTVPKKGRTSGPEDKQEGVVCQRKWYFF